MNRIPFLARLLALASPLVLATLLSPASSQAQYMYLDANGDGIHTDADVLSASGPTTVAIWLDTHRDRDGSVQTCNSHTRAPASWDGPSPDPGLDFFSYDIRLLASQGTVLWGEFADGLGFDSVGPDYYDTYAPNEFYASRFADLGDERPAGLYKLGEITIEVQYGTPSITFGLMSGAEQTCFGTHCKATQQFPNSYVYGVDWFDADGLAYGGTIDNGGVVVHVPVLDQPGPITVVESQIADVPLTASDVDGQPLAFSKLAGPTYVTVSTFTPGAGLGSGRIHVTPLASDVGTASIVVRVTDGNFSCDRAVTVSILRELELGWQPDRSVVAGTRVEQPLIAGNPLNRRITFYLASGPSFMTVSNPGENRGRLALAPTQEDIGTWTATIGVTHGAIRDEKTFTVEVLRDGINHPPIASIGGPLEGVVGRALQLDVSRCSDPDGDRLDYSWTFGDGSSGLAGKSVAHEYSTEGEYTIGLTVRDPDFVVPTTTVARIRPHAAARAFTVAGAGAVLAGGIARDLCVRVEPVGAVFAACDLVATNVSLVSTIDGVTREITATGFDPDVTTDCDRNGMVDRGLLFAGRDVAALLERVPGRRTVDLSLRGTLAGGGHFVAPLEIPVVRRGGPLSAGIAPNPMNPVGELSFVTSKAGTADVRIFDVSGRLARHAVDRQVIPVGYHAVTLDGRGDLGEVLPSGVYYYVIETPEGRARGRFAIVR